MVAKTGASHRGKTNDGSQTARVKGGGYVEQGKPESCCSDGRSIG